MVFPIGLPVIPNARLIGALVAVGVIIAGLSAAAIAGSNYGAEKANKKSAPIIAGLQTEVAQCKADLGNTRAKLDIQNDAVKKLEDDSAQRTKRAQEAVKKAEKRAQGYRAEIARIQAFQGGPDRCESARELLYSTLKEGQQ